jgi:hypothetical protein
MFTKLKVFPFFSRWISKPVGAQNQNRYSEYSFQKYSLNLQKNIPKNQFLYGTV